MKRSAFFLFACALAAPVFAQGETSWREGDKVRAYVAPVVKIFELEDVNRVLVGGRVVWVNRYHYAFGPEAYILTRKAWIEDQGVIGSNVPMDYYLMMAYGGIVFEYIVGLSKRFRVSGELHGGTGMLNIECELLHGGHVIWERQDMFVVIEPGANFLVKMSRFVWLGFGVNYRFVRGLESRPNLYWPFWIDNSRVSGLVGTLTVRFGRM